MIGYFNIRLNNLSNSSYIYDINLIVDIIVDRGLYCQVIMAIIHHRDNDRNNSRKKQPHLYIYMDIPRKLRVCELKNHHLQKVKEIANC